MMAKENVRAQCILLVLLVSVFCLLVVDARDIPGRSQCIYTICSNILMVLTANVCPAASSLIGRVVEGVWCHAMTAC